MKNRLRELIQRYRSSCDYLELRFEEIEDLSFSFTKHEMNGVKKVFDRGVAIRACHKGGWAFASLNSLRRLEEIVPRVIEQAKKVGRSTTELAAVDPLEQIETMAPQHDPREIPLDTKVSIFQKYTELMLAHDPLIQNAQTSYEETITKKIFANSDGSLIDREFFDVRFSLKPFAISNGNSQFAYLTRGSTADPSLFFNLEKQIGETCDKAIQLLNAPSVKGGKYPVILDPYLGGTFVHEAFGHFSEADDYMDNPQIKETFPLGKKIGSDILSIYDTGLDKGTRGYLPFDDEGVPGSKTLLIENGILTGRLHNRESAAKFNEPLTGSARAKNYRFPPICRMRNTCIANGTSSFEELLDGIDEGVYAIRSIGGHGGEMFSFSALYGYMIRKGQIAEMVKNVSISGNLFTTLLNIDAIGNDFFIEDSAGGCGKGAQFPLPVTTSSPHFRIQEATVGGV